MFIPVPRNIDLELQKAVNKIKRDDRTAARLAKSKSSGVKYPDVKPPSET